jgi:hypothetical protein
MLQSRIYILIFNKLVTQLRLLSEKYMIQIFHRLRKSMTQGYFRLLDSAEGWELDGTDDKQPKMGNIPLARCT